MPPDYKVLWYIATSEDSRIQSLLFQDAHLLFKDFGAAGNPEVHI